PPSGNIDIPGKNGIVSGTITVSGWALDNTSAVGSAISAVHISVDGIVVGTATYGLSRPDVCAAYPGRIGCPNVGYTFLLNTTARTDERRAGKVSATDSATYPDKGSASITIMERGAAETEPPAASITNPR